MKFSNTWWILLLASGCAGKTVLLEGTSNAGAPSTRFGSAGDSSVGGTASTGPVGGTLGIGGDTDSTNADPNACTDVLDPSDVARPGYTAARSPEVASVLAKLPIEAKVKQLYGVPDPPSRDSAVYRDFMRSQEVAVPSGKTLRGFRYRIGGRGVNLVEGQDNRPTQGRDYSTAFPTASIRAASWDIALEARVGEAMGDETMASRNNLLVAPSADLIRHPFWGRTQEAYGEDAYHVGRMASALVAGIQRHVPACVTHFIANNIERNRSNQTALMDEQTLREIYARPFDMVVRDAGVACVLAAYNMVNYKKASQNQHLLMDILKAPIAQGGMGFRGFVLSDWWAMPGDQSTPDSATATRVALEAMNAGLDVEVPWALNYSVLPSLVGTYLGESQIDAAAGRVLEQKFRFNTAYTDSPWGIGTATSKLSNDSITNNDDHLALAEEVERKSAVLLHNGPAGIPVLPIARASSIAVVGLDVPVQVSGMTEPPLTGDHMKMALDVNVGDRGSSRVNPDPATSVGPFEGIKAVATSHAIANVSTGTTVDAASAADFVVVVVGLTAGDEGEEYSIDSLGDRRTLSIGSAQEDFVNDVLALNKPTAIIVESGSIVNLPWLNHSNQNQATIWAGYGGQRVGTALGKLLFGDANFSGKMPLAWPKESELPPFTSNEFATTMDYAFGYRYYDARNLEPGAPALVFPFGWGLSYSHFAYSDLAVLNPRCSSVSKNQVVNYTLNVKNDGPLAGEETVMLFVQGPPAGFTGKRSVKELKSFAKVSLAAGQTTTVTLQLRVQDLRHWEGNTSGKWVVDNGTYTIMVGPNASEAALNLRTQLEVHD